LIPKTVFLLSTEPVARFAGIEFHRVFGIDGATLSGAAFVLFNVILLAVILTKILYNPVRQFLFDRTERIRSQIKHAEDEKHSAIEMKAQYEAKIKNIELEREEILDAARKQATEKSKQLLDEAKTEADAIRDRAMRNVEMEQERVKDEMRQSIIELSSVMAQKFVARTIDNELQDQLFTEVMAEINDADFSQSNRVVAG